MENAEALRQALQKLAERRLALGSSLEASRGELQAINDEMVTLETRREAIRAKIRKGDTAYERLDATITQTEEGYQRVLDTAQTLMDVVALQMPDLEEEVEGSVST